MFQFVWANHWGCWIFAFIFSIHLNSNYDEMIAHKLEFVFLVKRSEVVSFDCCFSVLNIFVCCPKWMATAIITYLQFKPCDFYRSHSLSHSFHPANFWNQISIFLSVSLRYTSKSLRIRRCPSFLLGMKNIFISANINWI